MALTLDQERQIAETVAKYYDDPLGFVLNMYPWGEPRLADGSANPLRNKRGPERWQRRLLEKLGKHIRENGLWHALGWFEKKVWRSARASGHGVGKSALVAWLIQFLMSTRPDTRGVVTANTASQLETKTWPELAKWHNLLLCKHWFTWTATSYYFAKYPEDKRKNYMVNAVTVSAENTEAFAGLHNEGKTVFIIFDEASGIDAKVWEVAQGALTDGECFFFAFGNPTRPDGPFADCFDKHEAMFDLENIDSREVSHTNKTELNNLINMWGADSNEAKVRVYGQFPNQAYNGFISTDDVHDACNRELDYDPGAPIIMAVDVARFGDDESVIGWRQGRDARSRKQLIFKGLSTVKLAAIVIDQINRTRPDAVIIESTGVGAGVIDICRDRGYKIIEVHPGAMSSAPEHYVKVRDEIWAKMRDWIRTVGCLYADDPILITQLTSILYELDRHEQRIKLESKEDMKKRTGLSSPDRADTLALTFAVNIARRDVNMRNNAMVRREAVHEYDPLTH